MTAHLSKTKWLDHGLKILAASGAGRLKADPLAKSLKVTRGSFYWHFRDIGHFHDELLARWRQRATDDVIADAERDGTGGAQLKRLMRTAMLGDTRLERALRAWATQNAQAADAVRSVDKARIAYLAKTLASAGFSGRHASVRAAYIYWAYLGKIMMGPDAGNMTGAELDKIAEMLLS